MELLCCIVVLLSVSRLISCQNTDKYALISFKSSSVEKDSTGILSDWDIHSISLCSWFGVTCSTKGRVVALDLSNCGLVGRLQIQDLILLDSLKNVNLSGNRFRGDLSSNQSDRVCSFENVDLSNNSFSGLISEDFLLSCSHLISLNLSVNSISEGGYRPGPSLRELDLSHNLISTNDLLKYSLLNCQNLEVINFSNNKISGNLSTTASCKNLSVLDVSNNRIAGDIPKDFIVGSQSSLRRLNISHNNLTGNFSQFDFGLCSNLAELDLSWNGLSGTGFTSNLGNCLQLELLSLSHNQLQGSIPSILGNLSNLQRLYLSSNQFSGEIPEELGQTCKNLRELDLSKNNISGRIPSTFGSCLSLQILNLGNNNFYGDFIDSTISKLSSLRRFLAPFNNVTGPVPLSLMNCTALEVIDLSSNWIKGEIPSGICSSLPSLQQLLLPDNYLQGSIPSELGNCRNLTKINFSANDLTGFIPQEVWNLPRLKDIVIWANILTGELPENLCFSGKNLETLILNNNNLTGSIPSSISNCQKLSWFSLSTNHLTGNIPKGIGDLSNLAILQLGNNSLSGEIPKEIGNCKSLIWLDLNSNSIYGTIPPELAKQSGKVIPGVVSGKQFAFVRNQVNTTCKGTGGLLELEGIGQKRLEMFPIVRNCKNTRIYSGTTVYSFTTNNGSLIYLDLSYNSLIGSIPEEFGSMFYLQLLNLGHNKLTGTIPDTFEGLKNLGLLHLSNNYLHGPVAALGNLHFLNDLDVSNNNLSGLIPPIGQLTTFSASAFANNSGLCGVPLPPCWIKSIAPRTDSREKRHSISRGTITAISVSILFLLCLMLILYRLRIYQINEKQSGKYVDSPTTAGSTDWKLSSVLEPLSINVATFEKSLRKLTFADLLEATNGFHADTLIGSGGFGEVYKAKLNDGSVVAIKKLVHVTNQGDREFTAEMETIGKIKHRNLVPLLGYCKVGEERILVYEYMKWGSLESVLHDRNIGIYKLDWATRKKLAIGSARGLAFLHHSCIPHIIHRDMKSSNVLVDENFEARVSDFGMARLMNAHDTHLSVTTLAGTPGYVPPEYYQSIRCSTKGDVYSYGVILLEILSGKKPIDPNKFGDNNLVGWAKQLVQEKRISEIFDPELTTDKSRENELYHCLKIACECLDDRPTRRPTMIQVMAKYKQLRMDSGSDILDGLSIGDGTIEESGEKGV